MLPVPRPLHFVLASSNHGTLIVNRNDSYKGIGLGHQIFEKSCFDPTEVESVLGTLAIRREFFGDGVVAIDGGANVGVHTVEWARAMFGWGRVISFEAQERIYYALAGNIAINNCFNATAHHAALGGEEGSINVPLVDYGQASSFGSLELRPSQQNEFIGQQVDYSVAGTRKTRMTTIDSLALSRLDFIKLDIEGMEIEALAGAIKSIDTHKPMILLETLKSDAAVLRGWLQQRGYECFEQGINLLAVHASDPALPRLQLP